jgi:hypothetical protein
MIVEIQDKKTNKIPFTTSSHFQARAPKLFPPPPPPNPEKPYYTPDRWILSSDFIAGSWDN